MPDITMLVLCLENMLMVMLGLLMAILTKLKIINSHTIYIVIGDGEERKTAISYTMCSTRNRTHHMTTMPKQGEITISIIWKLQFLQSNESK